MKPQNAMKHQRKPPAPEARSLSPGPSETVPSPLDPPEGTASSPPQSPPLGGGSAPQGTSEGVERAPPADPELVKKAEERDLYRNELLRARADLENALKRMHRERQQAQDEAMRRFVADLLPVLDAFDRALGGEEATVESIRRGIVIVRSMLLKTFREQGVEEIQALGRPFDPFLHDAVVYEETTEYPPGTVSEVLETGYLYRGALVRAAKVKVARAPASAPSAPRAEGASEKEK